MRILVYFISLICTIVPILVNVAFVTLIERKIIGYAQSRKGPNKVSVFGVLQPFADAVKLFLKENLFPEKTNFWVFFLSPVYSLGLILLLWGIRRWTAFSLDYSLIRVLLILGLGLYPLLLAGWSSNRRYATIGGLRGVAQTISYEVRLALILITYFVVVRRIRVTQLELLRRHVIFFLIPIFAIWVVAGLAETNRTPFDFAEGESELVSGFNVEYGAGGFALIFIAEYGMILFFRFFRCRLLGWRVEEGRTGIVVVCLMAFFWIWTRCTLPRYRYDKLIGLAWKGLLPCSLAALVVCAAI